MKIKALSIWEPWATLMRLGAKTIETRSWSTSYRGPLLICAAKKRVSKNMWANLPSEIGYALGSFALSKVHERLHYGQAVAIVELSKCIRTLALVFDERISQEFALGDYSLGRWGWVTSNLRVIEPFPVRGQQGLFEVELPPGIKL